jgi:hypothetical protein
MSDFAAILTCRHCGTVRTVDANISARVLAHNEIKPWVQIQLPFTTQYALFCEDCTRLVKNFVGKFLNITVD